MNKIALLYGTFHKEEIETMLAAARTKAREAHLEIVEEVGVPGSLEKPLALKRLLAAGDVDGVVVLGIIERGETKHGLVMGQTVTDALLNLSLVYDTPLGMGILGPEILPEQITPRVVPYAQAAVDALAHMLKNAS